MSSELACYKCKRQLTKRGNLVQHLKPRKRASAFNNFREEKGKFVCNLCDRSYMEKYSFITHRSTGRCERFIEKKKRTLKEVIVIDELINMTDINTGRVGTSSKVTKESDTQTMTLSSELSFGAALFAFSKFREQIMQGLDTLEGLLNLSQNSLKPSP